MTYWGAALAYCNCRYQSGGGGEVPRHQSADEMNSNISCSRVRSLQETLILLVHECATIYSAAVAIEWHTTSPLSDEYITPSRRTVEWNDQTGRRWRW
ncbi:hypothetical protein J6590_014562 [Homalodisca vitripennis]|nr:hypothetical protein J6590_014562 [Homalodisca vitripennis]